MAETIHLASARELDIEKTFECGQCFRWNADEDGVYRGAAYGYPARVWTENGEVYLCSDAPEELWRGVSTMPFALEIPDFPNGFNPKAFTILGEINVLVAPVSHIAFWDVYTLEGISPIAKSTGGHILHSVIIASIISELRWVNTGKATTVKN